MKDTPFIWADHELNATAVSEFRCVLPNFFEKDPNEASDWLVNKDAKRYGYTAITIANNGSKVVATDDLSELGCFVTIDNFYERPHLTLVLEDVSQLRTYVEQLLLFSPSQMDVMFHKDTSIEAVRAALDGIPCRKIGEIIETMYFGELLATENQINEFINGFIPR